jgi:hypothetical protein
MAEHTTSFHPEEISAMVDGTIEVEKNNMAEHTTLWPY